MAFLQQDALHLSDLFRHSAQQACGPDQPGRRMAYSCRLPPLLAITA